MENSRDELLTAAVEAHREYETAVEEAKAKRRRAFQAALRGPVTGRELAARTGLSESYVGRIAKGQR